MPERVIHLPLDRLPQSPTERHAVLRDYFCDKDGIVAPSSDGWSLTLAWSDDEYRYVDPGVGSALEQSWDGIARSEMWAARRRHGRILSTLFDTWTLHSWSEWLAKRKGGAPKSLTILHADDHRDFGAPRLFIRPSGFVDPFTECAFNLSNPASVASAIASGAVGMGSFMTPFLNAFPKATVRHLCQPPKVTSTRDFGIAQCYVRDALLDPEQLRPALEVVTADTAGLRYRVTSSVADWLDGVPSEGPILVHIDMDYFNNRYDGDSDWSSRPAILDPDLPTILSEVDRLLEALARPEVASRIEDIVIAYSPGFFPAEYWRSAGARLESGLRAIQ